MNTNPLPQTPYPTGHDPYRPRPAAPAADRGARTVAGVAVAVAALSIFLSFQVRADRAELTGADQTAAERITVLEGRVATLEGAVDVLRTTPVPAPDATVDTDGDGVVEPAAPPVDVEGLVEQGQQAGTVVRDLLARLAGTLEDLLSTDRP